MNVTQSRRAGLAVALIITTVAAVIIGRLGARVEARGKASEPALSEKIDPAKNEDTRNPLTVAEDSDPNSGRTIAQHQGDGLPQEASAIEEDPDSRTARLERNMREYARSEKWEEVYRGLTSEDLDREQDSVEQAIGVATVEEFDRRFKMGQYKAVSTNGHYRPEHFNPYDVYAVRFLDTGEVIKASLPEEGNEALYKLRAQSAWLGSQSHARLALTPSR